MPRARLRSSRNRSSVTPCADAPHGKLVDEPLINSVFPDLAVAVELKEFCLEVRLWNILQPLMALPLSLQKMLQALISIQQSLVQIEYDAANRIHRFEDNRWALQLVKKKVLEQGHLILARIADPVDLPRPGHLWWKRRA